MDLLRYFSLFQRYLIVYIVAINITTFLVFLVDKIKARKKKWRISEGFLFILGLLGGAVGGLCSMAMFHHKVSKLKFTIGFPIMVILNFIMTLYIAGLIR